MEVNLLSSAYSILVGLTANVLQDTIQVKYSILVNDVISKRAKDTGIGMALLLSAIKVNCVVSVCELIVDQEQEQ